MEIGLDSSSSSGILLIDKPTGMTSHDVVYKVRKKTDVKRVGHTGTLDPLATGLLIILVGREFTKRQNEFLKLDKEYICEAQLGIETDTYDADGKVIQRAKWKELKEISQTNLKKVLENFRGEIIQIVPAYSAVKIKGQKLYEKARKGEIIKDLPSKKIDIKKLELLDFKKDQQKIFFTIKVVCSSGTYIRSLVHDIGQLLGVGATITSLRRISIGKYKIKDAMTLQSFVV